MHVSDMIAFWARTKPHQPAIIQPDTIVTYRALDDAINSVAHRLSEFGLDPNKTVAVAIENPAKQLAVAFGLLRSGFSTAPIFPGLMAHLRPAGIADVIYEGEGQILSGGKNIRFDDSWLLNAAATRFRGASVVSPAPDMIFFTSGATGLPKKIVQTEASLIARMNIVAQSGDHFSRVLILPSLGSNFGFNRTCEVLCQGKTACYALPGIGRLILISTYGIDRINGSPQQLLELVELRENNPGHQIDSVKMVRIAGAFAGPEAVNRIKIGICRNVETDYGSTEAALIAVGMAEMTAGIPDAVGFVGPWTELEILDHNEMPLPPGQEGRIRLRTPFFTLNYAANNPGFTGDPTTQWYYPGDIGLVTENGVLCIRGRVDDIINCGGHKVSARSLDDVVIACTGIGDAGVCGVRNSGGIDEVWIGIVPKPDFQLAVLQRELEANELFAPLLRSIGAEVIAIDAIPRNQLGKIQRHELKSQLIALSQAQPRENDASAAMNP